MAAGVIRSVDSAAHRDRTQQEAIGPASVTPGEPSRDRDPETALQLIQIRRRSSQWTLGQLRVDLLRGRARVQRDLCYGLIRAFEMEHGCSGLRRLPSVRLHFMDRTSDDIFESRNLHRHHVTERRR